MQVIPGKRVFISHASADAPFAEWLDGELQTAGFHTWLDAREIRVGDRLTRKLGEAVNDALAVIAVISPATADARWMWLELGQAIHRMVTDDQFKVLPALIADAPLPGELRDLVYADFRIDRKAGLDKLVSALRALTRDDWWQHYRTRRQAVESAVTDVFGSIASASLIGGYRIPNMDLIELRFQGSGVAEAAVEIDPGDIDEFWIDGLASTMEWYGAKVALILTDAAPTDLFSEVADGVFIGASSKHHFAHAVLLEHDFSPEIVRARLWRIRDAMEAYLWPW